MGIKDSALSLLSRGKFFAKAHSPEICMIFGTVELVATIVTACKGAIKFQKVLENHNERLDKIHEQAKAIERGEYADDVMKDPNYLRNARYNVYWSTAKGFVRCFWKTAALGTGTALTYGAAVAIVNKRLADTAAVAAAAITQNRKLEDAIVEDMGAEKLAELKGMSEKDAVIESHTDPETGETVVDAVKYPKVETPKFAIWFDERNNSFEKMRKAFYDNYDKGRGTPNYTYLTQKLNYLQWRLETRGFLFGNEVLQALDYDDKDLFEEGWTYGWKYYKDPEEAKRHGAANFIDFGLENPINALFMKAQQDKCMIVLNVDPEPIIGAIGYRKAS